MIKVFIVLAEMLIKIHCCLMWTKALKTRWMLDLNSNLLLRNNKNEFEMVLLHLEYDGWRGTDRSSFGLMGTALYMVT